MHWFNVNRPVRFHRRLLSGSALFVFTLALLCGSGVSHGAAPRRGETRPDTVPLHGDSVIEFASVESGKQLLGRRDTFVKSLSVFDRQSRLGRAEHTSVDDLLKFVVDQVRPWEIEERTRMADTLATVRNRLKPFRLPFPERVLLIKTTGKDEGAAAYTREAAIILPQKLVDRPGPSLERLMLHELFHVLSRNAPKLRDSLYNVVGFQPCPRIELPAQLKDRKITNPDAPVVQHYITLKDGEREVPVAPVLLSKADKYDPRRGGSFFAYLTFRFIVLESHNKSMRVKLTDGEPELLNPRDSKSYFEQIGRNTKYIIHPDEILADNFVMLAMGTKTVATPRVIDGMRKILTPKKKG